MYDEAETLIDDRKDEVYQQQQCAIETSRSRLVLVSSGDYERLHRLLIAIAPRISQKWIETLQR